jgi:hypothetical protein
MGTEERTSGEGQSPFRKRTKRDNFVDIFHGKGVAKGKAPIDEIPFLQKALQHQICKIVARTLTNCPLAGCRLRFFQVLLVGFLRRHFEFVKPRAVHTMLGGYGRRPEGFRLRRAVEG